MTEKKKKAKERSAEEWKELILDRIEPRFVIKVACAVWWSYAEQIKRDVWFYETRNEYTPDHEIPKEDLIKCLTLIDMPKKKIISTTASKWWDDEENKRRHNQKQRERALRRKQNDRTRIV